MDYDDEIIPNDLNAHHQQYQQKVVPLDIHRHLSAMKRKKTNNNLKKKKSVKFEFRYDYITSLNFVVCYDVK